MRRSKYLSLTDSTPDSIPCPRAWHLCPDKDVFVAKELAPVSDTNDDDGTVIYCFPYTQQQLKELVKPGK